MPGRRRNYREQSHAKQCSLCRHFDTIRQPIYEGEMRYKVTVPICRLDHEPVEKYGICDSFLGPDVGTHSRVEFKRVSAPIGGM